MEWVHDLLVAALWGSSAGTVTLAAHHVREQRARRIHRRAMRIWKQHRDRNGRWP